MGAYPPSQFTSQSYMANLTRRKNKFASEANPLLLAAIEAIGDSDNPEKTKKYLHRRDTYIHGFQSGRNIKRPFVTF